MDTSDQTQSTTREKIKLTGNRMVEEVKRIMHEGNVRRIVVKQDDRTIAEFPLAVGVVGTLLAAPLAALGALAALLNECTIEVERTEPVSTDQTSDQPAEIPSGVEQSVGQPADPKITTPA
jgi:Domain of unknown function (DUF4342)